MAILRTRLDPSKSGDLLTQRGATFHAGAIFHVDGAIFHVAECHISRSKTSYFIEIQELMAHRRKKKEKL